MSKVNGKFVQRYLKGLPENGLLEQEESFLVSNWEEGAKLWRCNTDRTDIVEYLEQFGIPALSYPKTGSWNVKRPWEYPYLILVTPIAHQLFKNLSFHQACDGGWTWVRPAEKITATWEWEFKQGR
jgi:hypothetical protein